MHRIEPVGPPTAKRVELDSLHDEAAIRQIAGPGGIQVIRFQQLQLQRHRQAVLDPPVADTHQALAALDHGADHQRLQAGEVGQTIGVAGRGEPGPEPVRGLVDRRIPGPCPRQDAGADQVADHRVARLRRIGVVAHQVARAVAQPADRGADLGVGAGAGDHPAFRPPADARALVAAGEHRDRRPDARAPQRRGGRHPANGAVEHNSSRQNPVTPYGTRRDCGAVAADLRRRPSRFRSF